MRLGELAAVLECGGCTAAVREREVSSLVQDSRAAGPGSLFVAVRGFHSDGHRFVSQALARGAIAVVAEQGVPIDAPADAPVIRVPDSRIALAKLATAFYRYPSRRLVLVGITGTNGKTTTSYLVRSILSAAGRISGLIGTIEYRIGDRVYPAPNTTPESLDVQRLLAEMVAAGATHCVMEVSSHALALGRTDGCEFHAAAFTNLTQDHLDFHGTMEAYFRAKLLLFAGLGQDAAAVVNSDDLRAKEIIRATRARVITVGLSGRPDVRPQGEVSHGIAGVAFTAETPAGPVAVESPLVGRHNISNILTAIGLGVALGLPNGAIAAGLKAMRAVPGRMEKVEAGQPFGIIVDYAHTEDALVRLLEAVREVAKKRVITVFGCGGDRDRTKRPKMGAAALAGSDLVIVTSDNPRTEDPLAIIGEIEGGMQEAGIRAEDTGDLGRAPAGRRPYLVIPDRAGAIRTAIEAADAGDVVVLAGKGHEDYQIIGEQKHHFDDREEARSAVRKRRASVGSQERPSSGSGMSESDRQTFEQLLGRLQHMEIKGVSIDSRTVKEGELFIALKGDRFDGHDFVPDAIRRGAWGALVERSALEERYAAMSGLTNVIPVEDTLVSLQEMALMHRKKYLIPVVGITGSNGKTTTKEMLASILLHKGPVLKNEGNLNNHIGVPLTLLKLNARHHAAIIEMGMSGLGEIATLARIAMPSVGVITNIGPAHLEFLGSIDTVARAKAELLQGLRSNGTAVLNGDDRYFETLRGKFSGRTLSFGLDAKADVRADGIRQGQDATDLVLHADGRSVKVRIRTAGRHNVYNALAAAAAAIALDQPLETVQYGLEDFRPVAMRSEIRDLKGITVIADCYNANPASMQAALEMLASLRRGDRKLIVVVGDMLELGEAGPEAHRAVGRSAAELGIDLLVTVGPLSVNAAEGALRAGMAKDQVVEAGTTTRAAAVLRERAHPGDTVLVKGSRGMKMEKILEEL